MVAAAAVVVGGERGSNDGPLGGGEVDGLDADGQGFLQLLQDVTAGALRGRVVQQLFEGLQLDEDHHVLQEVPLDVGRQLRGVQELRRERKGEVLFFGVLVFITRISEKCRGCDISVLFGSKSPI